MGIVEMPKTKFILPLLLVCFSTTMVLAIENVESEKTEKEKIEYRIKQKFVQIQRFELMGKFSKDHAKSDRIKVEKIQKQEKTYLKQNGTDDLTNDQANLLNQKLDALSGEIPTTNKTKVTLY